MKIIFGLLFILSFVSCTKNSDERFDKNLKTNILLSTKKIAFIQYNTKTDNYDNWQNHLGDIFIYNLIDSSLVKYSSDGYREEALCWSPDGRKLLFASPRKQFLAPTHEYPEATKCLYLFTLDLLTGDIKELTPECLSDGNIHYITGLAWLNDGIYLTTFDNMIYKVNENGVTSETTFIFDRKYKIRGLKVSNNENYLALEIKDENTKNSNIALYKISKSAVNIFDINYNLGGWSFDDKSLLLIRKDSVFTFNINSQEISDLKLFGNNDSTKVYDCYWLSNNELLEVSGENYHSPLYKKSIRDLNQNRAIIIENIKSGKLQTLLMDSHEPRNFVVFNKSRDILSKDIFK